ncbi:MAG: PQ-loop domain-containing transporter [bacterium]|nr:PQ-loop domain-containing transporter [bacterium]
MRMHHHPSVRKRLPAARHGREPYPSQRFWFRVLDRIVLAAGIVAPVFTLPQIVLIYSTHSAAGVSALTWGVYALLDIPWILYGIAHRERPIVYTYTLWLVANAVVAVGAIVYQ